MSDHAADLVGAGGSDVAGMPLDPAALKAQRRSKGLRQRDLALYAGLSEGYVSQLETGVRPGGPATIGRLARALGVPSTELVVHDTDCGGMNGVVVRLNRAALIAIRETLGLTQGELARRSGLSQGHIAGIESGDKKPRPGTISKLATALLVPAPALLLTDDEIVVSLKATRLMLTQAPQEMWDDPEARRVGRQLRSFLLNVSALDDKRPQRQRRRR